MRGSYKVKLHDQLFCRYYDKSVTTVGEKYRYTLTKLFCKSVLRQATITRIYQKCIFFLLYGINIAVELDQNQQYRPNS